MTRSDNNFVEDRYSVNARVLHWVMAAGFFFMWACGYAMTSLVPEDSEIEHFLFQAHISIGAILFFLMIARIFVRLTSKTPAPLENLSKWERIGSHAGHYGLYFLAALILLIGWAEVDFGGWGVKVFGIHMPKLFPTMKTLWGMDLEATTELIHMIGAYALLALTVVHVAAVIKHKWFDGHDVLYRMTFSKEK